VQSDNTVVQTTIIYVHCVCVAWSNKTNAPESTAQSPKVMKMKKNDTYSKVAIWLPAEFNIILTLTSFK